MKKRKVLITGAICTMLLLPCPTYGENLGETETAELSEARSATVSNVQILQYNYRDDGTIINISDGNGTVLYEFVYDNEGQLISITRR